MTPPQSTKGGGRKSRSTSKGYVGQQKQVAKTTHPKHTDTNKEPQRAPARSSQCWSRQTQHGLGVCI